MNNEEQKVKDFNNWRKEIGKLLPSLAIRVFALRNKMYYGCGFHWALEKDLGFIINVMNDFDKDYRKMAERIVIEVRYENFLQKLERAESNVDPTLTLIDHATMIEELMKFLRG